MCYSVKLLSCQGSSYPSLLLFFSMSCQACLPLAFHLISEVARPDSTYIYPLVDLDMDLFPDDNKGVQAICDDWGVMQEALMVSFLV